MSNQDTFGLDIIKIMNANDVEENETLDQYVQRMLKIEEKEFLDDEEDQG